MGLGSTTDMVSVGGRRGGSGEVDGTGRCRDDNGATAARVDGLQRRHFAAAHKGCDSLVTAQALPLGQRCRGDRASRRRRVCSRRSRGGGRRGSGPIQWSARRWKQASRRGCLGRKQRFREVRVPHSAREDIVAQSPSTARSREGRRGCERQVGRCCRRGGRRRRPGRRGGRRPGRRPGSPREEGVAAAPLSRRTARGLGSASSTR